MDFLHVSATHDECQRWLDDHSRLKAYAAGNGSVFQIAGVQQQQNNSARISPDSGDDPADQDGDDKITDRQLRIVFRGLVEAAGNRSS